MPLNCYDILWIPNAIDLHKLPSHEVLKGDCVVKIGSSPLVMEEIDPRNEMQ